MAPTSPSETADNLNEEELDNTRKRQIDDEQAPIREGPAKRPRLSNGFDNNGFESAPPTAMDVDAEPNGDGRAYPSPEQVPWPIIVTNGPEQGTQVDKVTDLSTETTFLDLTEDISSRASTLLHCAWHPRDPTILAAAGTDALARMWTFTASPHARATQTTGPDSDQVGVAQNAADAPKPHGEKGEGNLVPNGNTNHLDAHVSNGITNGETKMPSQRNLLEPGAPSTTTATALCWASDGSGLLVANEPVEDARARIDVYASFGLRVTSFDGFESPVFCVRWNYSNTLILALSPYAGSTGALISVIHPDSQTALHHAIPGHDLSEQPLDVVWTSDEDFIICGGDMLQAFRAADGAVTAIRKYETHDDHALSKVAFDWPSQLLATASDLGKIDVWDRDGACPSFDAHQGLITALAWQPLPGHVPKLLEDASERLLASAGEDGAISIWDARSQNTKPKASMTMRSAVLALAFTPDGAFIAGATSEEVLIWKVDDVTMPRACWNRGSEMGWQTPMSRDSAPEEDHYCLCWDADGKKLAYGVNNLVC